MITGVAVGVFSAGTARATFFSFASDVNSNAFTFAGTAGSGGSFSITDFSRPNTYSLLVDDNNGPLPSVAIPVELHANLSVTSGTSTLVAGTLYQHTYHVTGTFGFYDMMGNALLTVAVGPNNFGVLTVPGTATAWSPTGAVLGADSYADVTYTSTSALVAAMGGTAAAAQYGITVGAGGTGTSVGPDDFAFDLSVINTGSIGSGVAIDPTTKLPTSAWRSESSFSGSAFGGIPSPGALSLLLLGGLTAVRRTRR
jgi:hypothetical protein